MSQKKLKLKISTLGKSYSYKDSALFGIKTKRKLAKTLKVDLGQLKLLASSDSNYKQFTQAGKSGKSRNIQYPVGVRDFVHTRLASLLCRVKQPDYVHSGIKGRSHITNAKVHRNRAYVIKTDISSFYESTTRKMVFDFFYKS